MIVEKLYYGHETNIRTSRLEMYTPNTSKRTDKHYRSKLVKTFLVKFRHSREPPQSRSPSRQTLSIVPIHFPELDFNFGLLQNSCFKTVHTSGFCGLIKCISELYTSYLYSYFCEKSVSQKI